MIWVVGEPQHDLEQWGRVVELAPFYSDEGKKAGIIQAMRNAVWLMNIGDVICQNDVRFTESPLEVPPAFGTVRTFTEPISHRHCCPRAFAIYDEPTRRAVLEAWEDGTWACVDWRDVPKTSDILIAVHDRGGTP